MPTCRGALLLLFVAVAASAAEDSGILLEAEDFKSKVSDEKDFASAARERAASRHKVLTRFFKKGYLLYEFEAPVKGQYSAWLRYGAKHGQFIGSALDPKGVPAFVRVKAPATGGYIGPGVWGWVRLFRASLAKGKHSIALSNATMRVDCLYITRSNAMPTDDVIKRKPKPLPPEIQALVDKPLCPVTPSWLDNAADYKLPAWYGEYRVQAHTRLSLRWLDKPIFFHAAEAFRQMGVHTFVRHIKSGGEGAWWKSSVGATDPKALNRNIAQEIIDNAHKAGCRIIVYYRHMEDNWVVKEHPDWAARDWKGNLVKKRGYKACFNSPYADFVQTRLLELVDMGADAFYFDEVHFPKTGCWCAYCKRLFKAETGLDHPKEPNPEDLVWQKLIGFNNLSIERTFLKWRKAIHARNPNVVMLIGSNTWPAMGERHMTGRLFRIADSMKTEFSLPARGGGNAIFSGVPSMKPIEKDAKLALGYTLARDACDGRPAHIWTHGLLDERSAVYASAGVMTHGCIANLDIPEATIPNMMFAKAFALGNKVSKHFAGRMPLRWAAVHYSEYARDHFLVDEVERVKRVLYPTYAAYAALLRARLPVGVVTDTQLEQGLLDGYKVLFLPAPQLLTQRMRAAVASFKARGGLVVKNRPEWLWHDAKAGARATEEFMAVVSDAAKAAPVQAFGGPEKMHVVAFVSEDRKRLTVSLCNDFSWVYTGRRKTRDGKTIDVSRFTKAPPPCRGVKVVLRGMDRPKRVVEGVSGRPLEARPGAHGLEIALPPFDSMAVVALKLD